MALRAVEKGILAYIGITLAVIAARAPHIPKIGELLVNRGIVIAVILAFRGLKIPRRYQWTRDWYPIALALLFYSEMDQLNRAFGHGFYDIYVIQWEQAVFHGQPSITLRQQFPQVWLSEYLHFAYFSYYLVLPALGAMLYAWGKQAEFRYCVAATATTFFCGMLLFIVFPVAGPYYMYPQAQASQVGPVLPSMIHWILARAAAVGTAFPSSHVAISMTVLFSAWVADRRAFWVLMTVVPGLAVGAVYGGFHYAIDAVAGFGLAALVSYLMLVRPGWARHDRTNGGNGTGLAKPPGLPL